jgi:hypothetical protein
MGKDEERVRLVELPIEQRALALRAFLEQVPGGVRSFGSSDPRTVVAAADRYPVVRAESD